MIFRKKRKNRDNSLPRIFPLSPDSGLDNNKLSGFDVYKNHLTAALENSRIHNIVLTGNFGIGKSSVIRSIEKEYIKRKRAGFLYVSLGDYTSPISEIKAIPNESIRKLKKNNVKNDVIHQNLLERRLLFQIYVRFRRKQLPASSFKMVQEHGFLSKIGIPFWCAISSFIIFLLCFFDAISNLISEGITQLYSWCFQKANMSVEEQTNKLLRLAETIRHCELWAHALLYLFVAIIIAVSVGFIVMRAIPKLRIKALNIKTNTLEATCENNACESYLDQYTTEIVYCLEKIANKISYTLVIEDLDRLNEKSCVDIFTRLREINQLVNLRLSKKKSNKHMRFIYVANDWMISRLNCSKFADYIMPVFPRLNEKTAEDILTVNLSKTIEDINQKLEVDLKIDTFNDIIKLIAPFLKDYRLQYAVLNEFSLLFRIYYESNKGNKENSTIDSVAKNVLAMAFYKNLFPNDYNKISTGESSVFPIYKPYDFSNEKERSLLDALTNSSNPLLNCSCLYYAGYSSENIIKLYKAKLDTNLAETLNYIKNDNSIEVERALYNYCDSLTYAIALSKETTECYENARLVITVLLERGSQHWGWLFNEKIWAISVLEILSDETYGDEMLKRLFDLAGFDIEGDESIYDKCREKVVGNITILGTETISTARDLTSREYTILCLGVGEKYVSTFRVTVNAVPMAVTRTSVYVP